MPRRTPTATAAARPPPRRPCRPFPGSCLMCRLRLKRPETDPVRPDRPVPTDSAASANLRPPVARIATALPPAGTLPVVWPPANRPPPAAPNALSVMPTGPAVIYWVRTAVLPLLIAPAPSISPAFRTPVLMTAWLHRTARPDPCATYRPASITRPCPAPAINPEAVTPPAMTAPGCGTIIAALSATVQPQQTAPPARGAAYPPATMGRTSPAAVTAAAIVTPRATTASGLGPTIVRWPVVRLKSIRHPAAM